MTVLSRLTARFGRLAGLLLLSANAAIAQSDSVATPGPRLWRIGGTLMLPMGQDVDPSFGALSFTATAARPLRVGPDLAVAVIPRGLQFGALLAGARMNLGVPIPIGRNVTIVPSGGLSLVAAVGPGGFAGGQGANGTLALHLIDSPDTRTAAAYGLRMAFSQHVFSGNGSLRMVEIGFVRR